MSGLGEPSRPAIKDGVAFIAAPLDRTPPRRPRSQRSSRRAAPCTPFAGSDALVGGASAFLLDMKMASSRDNKVIIPIVLLVVLLILMVLLLRALLAPLLLIGTVVLSFGAALGLSAR